MTRLDGDQLLVGVQALYGDVKFSPAAGISAFLGGDDGGNAIGWLPGASFLL
jgi:long-chain fatty acid transport protein